MGETTRIGWCDRTWSPWHGCAKVSEGCTNCYAESMSKRNPVVLGIWGVNGTRVASKGWDKPRKWDEQAARAGERIRVFPSICDPFEDRPELIDPRSRFLRLIRDTPNLDWLVLTKRPENAARMLARAEWALDPDAAGPFPPESPRALPPNLWLGVSAENQDRADERIPILLDIPAVVRWVSAEPLLGPIDFEDHLDCGYESGGPAGWIPRPSLDWVVVGGESGPGRRPMGIDWLISIVEQCRAASVPCYVKQDAAHRDGQQGRIPDELWSIKQHPATEAAPR